MIEKVFEFCKLPRFGTEANPNKFYISKSFTHNALKSQKVFKIAFFVDDLIQKLT